VRHGVIRSITGKIFWGHVTTPFREDQSDLQSIFLQKLSQAIVQITQNRERLKGVCGFVCQAVIGL
jgi:hypothetical protein